MLCPVIVYLYVIMKLCAFEMDVWNVASEAYFELPFRTQDEQ